MVWWLTFTKSQALHLGILSLKNTLWFPCTFIHHMRIQNYKCWNSICSSLQCHQSSLFWEWVSFWLARSVTPKYISNDLYPYIYGWIEDIHQLEHYCLGYTWFTPSELVRPSLNLYFSHSSWFMYNYNSCYVNELWRYICIILVCE